VAGNHDRFARRAEYVTTVGPLRLIVADTSLPGRDDGALDVARLATTLDDDTPTIIAMHHPPIRIGMPWIDDIGLQDPDSLAALLRTKSNVLAVLCGHVHRTVTGSCGGVPVHICTAAYQQAVLEFGATEAELGNDPPALLVHALLDSGELVTHVQPI
jgi:Icc protein